MPTYPFDLEAKKKYPAFKCSSLCFSVINGEKSAFNNTVFGKRRKRTIEAIINNLHSNYDRENFKVYFDCLTVYTNE